MRLSYNKSDGTQMEFELGEKPITVGRSPDADVILLDERSSRIHCGIRFWDGDFYIKDLKSKNGTFVNGEKVDVSKLKPGDCIQVGGVTMMFEQEQGESPSDAARPKGYKTILREIVEEFRDVQEVTSLDELRANDTVPGDVQQEPIRITTRKRQKA